MLTAVAVRTGIQAIEYRGSSYFFSSELYAYTAPPVARQLRECSIRLAWWGHVRSPHVQSRP